MATSKGTRIGIWIIAVVMLVGTIGSFLVMVLANDNQRIDEAYQQEQYEKYLKDQAAQMEPIGGYEAASFDGSAVNELKREVLIEGEGAEVKATDSLNVSYFGWLQDGTIFDSSKKSGTDTPIDFSLSGVISGWTEGLTGVKEGSVVKLTIPADKAYGATGSGTIPADAPLQFIVKVHKIAKAEG